MNYFSYVIMEAAEKTSLGRPNYVLYGANILSRRSRVIFGSLHSIEYYLP